MGETRAERKARGAALRESVPRRAHADWQPAADRPDPIDVLQAANATRVPELVPIRHARMLASPFALLRGSAGMMAIDLAPTPITRLRVQACGDAHVGNFGQFATPERQIVFDVNDFDETLPGWWEWDVKRLAASLDSVARVRSTPNKVRRDLVRAAVHTYRSSMTEYAELGTLDMWYARIDIHQVVAWFPRRYRHIVERDIAKGRTRTHLRAKSKLTEVVDGHARFRDDPPLLVHFDNTEHDFEEVLMLIESYRASLADDTRELFDRFQLVDVARKVVGVGSVGTRCWVGLFEGPHHPTGDPLVLQVKEAGPSVMEPFAGASEVGHHGLRVVAGQRLTQASSDIFLGWAGANGSGRNYYVRQLWDFKGSGDPATMPIGKLSRYGALCARALARAHARTGDAVAISGYLGKNNSFDKAIAEFASKYGAQTERDHAALVEAVNDGRLEQHE